MASNISRLEAATEALDADARFKTAAQTAGFTEGAPPPERAPPEEAMEEPVPEAEGGQPPIMSREAEPPPSLRSAGIVDRTTDELREARRKLVVQMANEPEGLQNKAYESLLARIDRELSIRDPGAGVE